jgi:hypothetical protein
MFLQKMSPLCKFGVACDNKLCQFRHKNNSCDKNDTKKSNKKDKSESEDKFSFPNKQTLTKHVETKHKDELDDEDEVYPIDTCENIYNEIEDLIDHYGETAHNKWQAHKSETIVIKLNGDLMRHSNCFLLVSVA